jgi:DeoR family fructose operon transcriptional repressor
VSTLDKCGEGERSETTRPVGATLLRDGRLARHLADRRGVTVVTNGLPVLLALADSPDIEVVVLGGRLRQPNEVLVGPSVEHELRPITPDRVFLGTDGLVASRGLCSPTLQQSQLKHAMFHAGCESYGGPFQAGSGAVLILDR